MRALSHLSCLAALIGWPVLATDADRPPTLALRPTLEVDGGGVFFHQVLTTQGAGPESRRTGEDQGLRMEGSEAPPAPGIFLAPAPSLNQPTVLTRRQIVELVSRRNPELGASLTNLAGSESIRITRRARLLEESEVMGLLTTALQAEQVRDRGTLELRFTRPWTAVTVPDEPFSVRVLDLPTAGVTANFILRFELRTEKETFGPWQVPLQARIWREVLVARSPVPRGKALSQADLGVEQKDILTLREPLASAERESATLELAENLSTGAPVLRRSVRIRPVIVRGKLLDAVVREGLMLITVRVEALEDGIPGQSIRVRNAKTKREFYAQVQNEEVVLVSL